MKNKKKMISILILFLLIGAISIGYALISSNLNINGTSTINNPTWDIHFENIQVKSGSVTASTPATINADRNTVTYAVTLSIPGDYYEFTVDVVNAGTIDGEVESVTSTVNGRPISELPEYLRYSLTYEDGAEINNNYLLRSGETETYKVHIEFRSDIDASQLPTESEVITFNLINGMQQATSSAKERGFTGYVYSYDDGTYLGDDYSSIDNYYDNYQAVINATGQNFFIKYYVLDNIIQDAQIGYVYNSNLYYLSKASTDDIYNDDVVILNSSLGPSKCTDKTTLYECIDSLAIYQVYKTGRVELYNDGYYCYISVDNLLKCGNKNPH